MELEEKYVPLKVGQTAFFMPWKDIIISDEIINIHKKEYKKEGIIRKVTLYEFKHIQGMYRAYNSKEEIEMVLGL